MFTVSPPPPSHPGPERRSAEIDAKNKRITAYHESGHAIVAYYTKDAMPINKATIMPRGPTLGHVRTTLCTHSHSLACGPEDLYTHWGAWTGTKLASPIELSSTDPTMKRLGIFTNEIANLT